jgi:hypothetical protein
MGSTPAENPSVYRSNKVVSRIKDKIVSIYRLSNLHIQFTTKALPNSDDDFFVGQKA